MDIPRYALIAASILLGMMLLGEWTQFSAERKAVDQLATPLVSERAASAVADLPATVPVNQGSLNDSDLPSVAPEGGSTQALPSSLVSVFTDTLEVVIDLEGGDVVGAALKRFPLTLEDPEQPFVLLERNERRTYIAQSGLVGPDGIDQPARAVYSTAEPAYIQRPGEPLEVALQWQGEAPDLIAQKVFRFEPGSHIISVQHIITNRSDSTLQMAPFAQLKRDGSAAPTNSDSGMGMRPFLGAALTQPDQRFVKFDFEEMADEPFTADIPGGWVAMLQHYFVSAWVPASDQSYRYRTRHTTSGFNIAGFTGPVFSVAPGATHSVTTQLYVGPKNQHVLSELAPHLDLVVDYGWLWWIAQPLFWLLTLIQSVVINWGVAIIVLTVLVKLAFFQLSAASYRSMARMRKVQPRIMAIREEYANDKAKQSQAMMELYKKEKINPLGGCLPILIQMPVFIALYWVLMESVELRQAPFALWIDDLSAMDPYFVLPLLMGASMYYMQKLNPAPPDPMQAKIMQWMPVVFTFFFLWFPSGLVLYWLCNNLLSMGQQYVINRRIERGAL